MYRSRDIEMLRAQVTASALESTIAFLGSIKEGRKAILFVSQTIGRVGTGPMDTFTWLDAATRAANANNTSIYAFDPRGLDMNIRPSEILQSLAENTGGKQFSNNQPAQALREIVKNSSAFYLLGYASAKNPADGKFHKIAVKVKRPGVEVQSRTGLLRAVDDGDEHGEGEGGERRSAAGDLEGAVDDRRRAPHDDRRGSLGRRGAGARRQAARHRRVDAARWRVRRRRHGPRQRGGRPGVVRRPGPRQPDRVRRGPGYACASAASWSRPTARRATRPIPRSSCRISPPRRCPSPRRWCSAAGRRSSSARSRPSPIRCRSRAASSSAPIASSSASRSSDRPRADATVTANLLGRRGAQLATLPLKTVPGRGYEIDLPIGSIARGEYVIAIEASRGADQAKTLVSFRVGSPQQ